MKLPGDYGLDGRHFRAYGPCGLPCRAFPRFSRRVSVSRFFLGFPVGFHLVFRPGFSLGVLRFPMGFPSAFPRFPPGLFLGVPRFPRGSLDVPGLPWFPLGVPSSSGAECSPIFPVAPGTECSLFFPSNSRTECSPHFPSGSRGGPPMGGPPRAAQGSPMGVPWAVRGQPMGWFSSPPLVLFLKPFLSQPSAGEGRKA